MLVAAVRCLSIFRQIKCQKLTSNQHKQWPSHKKRSQHACQQKLDPRRGSGLRLIIMTPTVQLICHAPLTSSFVCVCVYGVCVCLCPVS